jgi:hypothetical protein
MFLVIVTWHFIGGGDARGDDVSKNRSAIAGIVTDSEDKPLVGVRIDISEAAPRIGRGIFCPSAYADCSKWVTTDKQGKFTFEQLDEALKFRLLAAFPGYETKHTKLIVPSATAVEIKLVTQPKYIDPARIVSGVVTDGKGQPVAGALVEPHGAKSKTKRWWGQVKGVNSAVTDAAGHFAMTVPDDMLALDVRIHGHGFCGIQVDQTLPGEAAKIAVQPGARVTGKLVHEGQPVAGMSVAVVQVDRGVSNGIFIAAVGDVTNKDGSFEFRHLPGSQQYCIYSVVGDAKRGTNERTNERTSERASERILAAKKFNMPASGETRDLGTLAVAAPVSIRGRVERIDGKPLPENLKLSLGREPAWDLVAVPVAEDGSFAAEGLPPET